LIGRDNILIISETEFLAKDTWNGDCQGGEEEDCHDGEGKDPLKSKSSGEELTDTKSCGEVAESEAHGVILVDEQEEQSIDQDAPDSDVGDDSSSQMMSVDSNSTIPVQGQESPSQRSSDGWNMDSASICVVSEIEGGQVEEVDDGDDLRPDVVTTNE